jgi:hypothetical protein
VADELSIDGRADEDRVVQPGPLSFAEWREQIDHVRAEERAAQEKWRDHDTERESGERDRDDGEHAEPEALTAVATLVVEKVDAGRRADPPAGDGRYRIRGASSRQSAMLAGPDEWG